MNEKIVEVLLIEDNAADALLIKHIIHAIEGISVHLIKVTTLSEAFPVLVNHSIDLVLLDLMLPDSQGKHTFSKLMSVNNQIPVVVLSGIDSRELALEAIQEGAQDYLVKGDIDSKLLERTIRYAIERSKLLNAQKKIQQDIQAQDQLLKIITQISAAFINLSSEQIDQAINQALHTLGAFLQVDKAFILELIEPDNTICSHFEWSAYAQPDRYHILSDISSQGYNWLLQKLHAEGVVRYYDINELPKESCNLCKALQSQQITSFVMTGLFYKNEVRAILGVATISRQGHWSTETISLLNTSGEVFYQAIKKKQTEERLKESEHKLHDSLGSSFIS